MKAHLQLLSKVFTYPTVSRAPDTRNRARFIVQCVRAAAVLKDRKPNQSFPKQQVGLMRDVSALDYELCSGVCACV